MTSLDKFNQLIKDSCDFISDMKLYEDIIEDLRIIDLLKRRFWKSLADDSYYIEECIDKYNDKNKDIYEWLKKLEAENED